MPVNPRNLGLRSMWHKISWEILGTAKVLVVYSATCDLIDTAATGKTMLCLHGYTMKKFKNKPSAGYNARGYIYIHTSHMSNGKLREYGTQNHCTIQHTATHTTGHRWNTEILMKHSFSCKPGRITITPMSETDPVFWKQHKSPRLSGKVDMGSIQESCPYTVYWGPGPTYPGTR